MNYREVELLGLKTLGDAGTEIIDVDVTDPITMIEVYFRILNDSSHVDNVPAQDALDKIELMDGGQVYLALSGSEAMAVAAYERGRFPRCWLNESASASQHVRIPIYFGRYVGDPDFAFDPTKLRNPQIKLTWSNKSEHATSETKAEVFAKIMEGVPSPSQVLLTKAIKSFVTAASGDEPTELPIDYPYRRLYVRAYESTTWIEAIITNFKLNCDVGKLIPFDMPSADFSDMCQEVFGLFTVHSFKRVDDTAYREARLGRCFGGSIVSSEPGIFISAIPTAPQYVMCYARHNDGSVENDVYAKAFLSGNLPEYTWCYQFGRPDDPATWFRASQYKGVKLTLTQGNVNAAASILIQQPRSLP